MVSHFPILGNSILLLLASWVSSQFHRRFCPGPEGVQCRRPPNSALPRVDQGIAGRASCGAGDWRKDPESPLNQSAALMNCDLMGI